MKQTSHGSPPTRFTETWASVYLDLLRGLAAIFVLLGHWRNLFFEDFPHIVGHRGLLLVPYTLSGAGHQSVVLFFVLSGYFIGGTVFRAVERNQWEWGGYLLRRVVRLWTVLIPALLLCLFWDRLGIHLGHAPALYGGRMPNHILPDVPPLLSARVFFSNLFFLQKVFTPPFGSDAALWSLANEFWYYLLFPLGLIALRSPALRIHRAVCAVLFVAAAWLVRDSILALFPLWLAGAVLFKLQPPSFAPRTGRYLRIGALLIYLPIFFAFGRLHQIPGLFSDYLLGALTFFLLWVLLSANDRFDPEALSVRGSRELARFSYTLYTVHIPLLVFILSLLGGDKRWQPTPRTILIAVGVLFAVLIYAYALAFLTEFRTDTIRYRLERLLGIVHAPPMLPSNPLAGPEIPRSNIADSGRKIPTTVR